MSKEVEEFVIDTSVVIEGVLTKLIEEGKVKGVIILHKAVVAEIEHQANYGRETGFRGLDELKKINALAADGKISVSYVGNRPGESQIRRAKSGEIDAMIRDLAWEKGATLITGDEVQGRTAEALGMRVQMIREEKEVDKKLGIEKYFDEQTMSIHLKEDVTPYVKKGKPGDFKFVAYEEKKLTRDEMKEFIDDIILKTHFFDDAFVEIDRKYSTIVQYADIRIVITRPPFSDGREITAVKPLVKLELEDYKLNERIIKRLEERAEGILIAGSPGSGKTTFARALANFYERKGRIVKTVESPRDLDLKPAITQYSKNFGSSQEIHDVLLLSRPDHTIFDEVRDTRDFKLYSDLRLSGIGMVGVIHSTTAINAIQRFIGRLELGVIPSVLDTIIFIEGGLTKHVLELVMTVKVPTGMIEADLSRPVIEVRDFLTRTLKYELYSYGEETVVIPISKEEKRGISKLAEESVRKKINKELPKNSSAKIELVGNSALIIRTDDKGARKLIGREGRNVQQLERELGLRIDVRTTDAENSDEKETITRRKGSSVKYKSREDNKYYYFDIKKSAKGRNVSFFSGEEFIFDAIVGKKGSIRVAKSGELGERIGALLQAGKRISVYA